MRKIWTLCLGATLLLGTTLGMTHTVYAQDQTAPAAGAASGPFADVPTDHWAYQAVDTLQKAGIVIGYPDGTYGGRRAMTRYEFAVAIARLLPLINANAASKSDLSALQQQMQSELDSNQQALDALKALVDEFQPELQQLGQDVAAIKARLDALEQRLAVVEAEQRRVVIHGGYNNITQAWVNTNSIDTADLDKDGYRVGDAGSNSYYEYSDYGYSDARRSHSASGNGYNFIGDGSTIGPGGNTSLWNDIQNYSDVLLTIDGRVSDNAHAIIKLEGGDYANFLSNLQGYSFYRQNGLDTASAFNNNGSQYGSFVDVYQAYLDTPVSLGPLTGAEVQVGRFGTQFTKYTLMAPNPSSYTAIPEDDSGDYTMDGAKLIFSAGPAHVQVYGAKNDLSADRMWMTAGPSAVAEDAGYRPGSLYGEGGENYEGYDNVTGHDYIVDQSAGGRITFGNTSNWTLGITGILARVNDFGYTGDLPDDPYKLAQGTTQTYDTLGIYGADFSGVLPFFKASGLTLNAEVAEVQTGSGSHFGNVNSNHANQAWEGTLGWATGPFAIKGGYQEVYSNFAAPGYWGHVATWINPTNVKGPIASASYTFSPRLVLAADGDWYEGAESTPAGLSTLGDYQSPLTGTGDKLNHYDVGLKYGLTSQYNVDLGYEYDQWNLTDNILSRGMIKSGKPTEQYITIGIGHSFNKNASLKLLYQILDYNDNGTGFDAYAVSTGNTNGHEHGGIAVTQFSVKF